ncbi:MAG: UDP-N-acetylmuramoyl-L-alanyl-D-glutamate--2,6-diaminopimelate ligase [Firmicutes bacterium]|nr:UDP-N-acetylmuramoyl-L-alanyl-D-glutamate--2,6-diaminopimelate ligase [Bacillota bacterium]
MNLKSIIENLNCSVEGNENLEVLHLTHNSKNIQKGSLYFCLVGGSVDGHSFASDAVESGAVGVVCQRPLNLKTTQIIVENSRSAMATIASNFYGNPSNDLKLITITGTNGKTTISYILQHILKQAGFNVGLIGTSGNYIGEIKLPSTLTTPDPIELHALFSKMKQAGVQIVVMEASAHAIYLNKLEGVVADVGMFTNLSQDHLDFFNSFEDYALVKVGYFNSNNCRAVVTNLDDIYGKQIFDNNPLISVGYSLENPSDSFAMDVVLRENGSSFTANILDDILKINFALSGRFNVYNSLAAATAAKIIGVSAKDIVDGIANVVSVDGRFNTIDCGNFSVVIDYAHTPDGLVNILKAIKEYCTARIITVFGCGGDRDKTKRFIMGKVAMQNSSYVVVTTDNPRSERPEDIISQILEGVLSVSDKHFTAITQREQAIWSAMRMAKKGDIVLIAGKGAEDYIEVHNVKHPFSDAETVKKWLSKIQVAKGVGGC